jgi:hypothetical protein
MVYRAISFEGRRESRAGREGGGWAEKGNDGDEGRGRDGSETAALACDK